MYLSRLWRLEVSAQNADVTRFWEVAAFSCPHVAEREWVCVWAHWRLEIKFKYMDEEIVTNIMPTTKNNLYRIFAFSCDSSEISQQSNMLSPPMLGPLRSARNSTPCLRICFSVTELPLEGALNKVHQ